jgi:hypothetical protein
VKCLIHEGRRPWRSPTRSLQHGVSNSHKGERYKEPAALAASENRQRPEHCRIRARDRDLFRGGHMAGGHMNRIFRLNKWPHRPMLHS